MAKPTAARHLSHPSVNSSNMATTTTTTMCNGAVSKVTRNRTLVVVIAFMLPALSVLWRMDGSNARYLEIATTSLRSSTATANTAAVPVTALDDDADLMDDDDVQQQYNSSTRQHRRHYNEVVQDNDDKVIFKQEAPVAPEQEQEQEPSLESVAGAIEFVVNRRRAYEQHNNTKFSVANHWKLRGNGWLFTYQNMVLAAETKGPQQQAQSSVSSHQMGRNVVKIWNVNFKLQNCHLLTLWVRVNGPEIFAGGPAVVMDNSTMSCHWEFEFDIQKAGVYEVDVKMQFWNGLAPVEMFKAIGNENEITQCPDTTIDKNVSDSIAENTHHNGFIGFKFYSPLGSCCEICRRVDGCSHWSTPPRNFDASFVRNGCELYYNQSLVDMKDIPKSHYLAQAGIPQQEQRRRRLGGVLHASGSPMSNNSEVAHFLGCGWSFHHTLDFPCLEGSLDDHVFMVNRTFVVEDPSSEAASSSAPKKKHHADLPLCQLKDETFREDNKRPGRWVREDLSNRNKTMCSLPREVDKNFTKMFEITAFNGDEPHCWHRDDLSKVGKACMEANCGLIKKTSKWQQSSLRKETDWMGTWRNYDCEYMEFTNNQLQQCITQRKIQSISTAGVSIAAMMREYLGLRMKDMKLYTPDDSPAGGESLSVVIDSLSWPHMLWHESEDEWVEKLRSLPEVDASKEEHFWVSSFFTSSEREPYVQVARAERLSLHAQQILTPKGYKMINAFELSAAFTYDTAGQGDGLHIIGPPMKAIFTKILHHMCSEFVNGTVYEL